MMASHHHHHHFCHHATASSAGAAACCQYPTCHQPPYPYPYPQPHPHPQPYASNTPEHFNPYTHQHYFQEQTETLTDPTVSALLHRISVLEAALRRRSSSSSSPSSSSVRSLRDAAARTIQAHFRAFLVRRSRTLGQLKQLASIKSKLGALKSSVLGRTHFDYVTVHRKAVGLMLILDGIEGGDSMIKDGKRSLAREFDKFLDFIDGLLLERRVPSSNEVKVRYSLVNNGERKLSSTNCEGSKRVNAGNLKGLVERIKKLEEGVDEEERELMKNPSVLSRKDGVSRLNSGGLLKRHGGFQPKAKKNVTFAKYDKVYKALSRDGGRFLVEGCDDSIDEDDLVNVDKELEEDLSREIEEIKVSSKDGHEDEDDVEAQSESSGSHSSDERHDGSER